MRMYNVEEKEFMVLDERISDYEVTSCELETVIKIKAIKVRKSKENVKSRWYWTPVSSLINFH